MTINAALGLTGVLLSILGFILRGRERLLAWLAALLAFGGIGVNA